MIFDTIKVVERMTDYRKLCIDLFGTDNETELKDIAGRLKGGRKNKLTETDVKNAIDLGAAPGGWSHYLALRGIQVDAVDPASLSQRLSTEKKIRHYKMTAQEFSRKHAAKSYDLLVDDMKMDTQMSTKIVCGLTEHLKDNGSIILTLKLPKNGVWKRIYESVSLLREYFTDIKVRQLFYNRSEVTIYAKKRTEFVKRNNK